MALVAEHEKDLEQVHVRKSWRDCLKSRLEKRLDLPYAVCAMQNLMKGELKLKAEKRRTTELAEEEKKSRI